MKERHRRFVLSAVTVLLLALPNALGAQTAADEATRSGPLFDELARMDSLLFDASFVTCRAEVANAIFDDDIEFYHDQTGLSSGDDLRENTVRLTESCPGRQGVSRVLERGSVEVHPLSDYGVIQMGRHRFVEVGAATHTVARFVHVWRRTPAGWRLTRVLSFDHRSMPNQ